MYPQGYDPHGNILGTVWNVSENPLEMFGVYLKRERKQAGYTLRKFATLTNFAISTLPRGENDHTVPVRADVEKLDKVLNARGRLVSEWESATSEGFPRGCVPRVRGRNGQSRSTPCRCRWFRGWFSRWGMRVRCSALVARPLHGTKWNDWHSFGCHGTTR